MAKYSSHHKLQKSTLRRVQRVSAPRLIGVNMIYQLKTHSKDNDSIKIDLSRSTNSIFKSTRTHIAVPQPPNPSRLGGLIGTVAASTSAPPYNLRSTIHVSHLQVETSKQTTPLPSKHLGPPPSIQRDRMKNPLIKLSIKLVETYIQINKVCTILKRLIGCL